MYNSVLFRIFHKVLQSSSLSNPRIFSSSVKKLPYLLLVVPILPFPSLCYLLIYLSYLWIYLFKVFPMNGIIQYMTSCVWLLSLNIMCSNAMLCYVSVLLSFLWPNNIPFYDYITFCLSPHQLMDISVV